MEFLMSKMTKKSQSRLDRNCLYCHKDSVCPAYFDFLTILELEVKVGWTDTVLIVNKDSVCPAYFDILAILDIRIPIWIYPNYCYINEAPVYHKISKYWHRQTWSKVYTQMSAKQCRSWSDVAEYLIVCSTSSRSFYTHQHTVKWDYHIQSNYSTVHLGFSKLLGKLVVKYVPTYTKGILKKKKKKTAKDLSNNAYAMFFFSWFSL